MPVRVADKKPDEGADKKAFAAAFILKCAAAGITAPDRIIAAAIRETETVKRAAYGAETLGSVLGSAATLPLIGSVGLPLAAGFAAGGIGGKMRNEADVDDAETMRMQAAANAYRRRAALAQAHAQVRKLIATDPSKYVSLS